MKKNGDKFYAIYSRKSKYTGKGESIDNQIEMCKKYLLNKYGNIEKDIIIFQDEGFTGYNVNRPQFQEMIDLVKAQKLKCIIVYRLDRISRNVSDFCKLKDELAKYDVSFISVTENFDTSSPMGMAMLMITSVFAQLERDTIAERIRDNMYELAKTGRWLGGTTPLGYSSKKIDVVTLDGKKKSLYKLEPILEEVNIVQLIWKKALELKGLSKLEGFLIKQGIKTRNNNMFTRFSLVNILKNPVYVKADENIKVFFQEMGITIYGKSNDFDGQHGLIAYNKRMEKTGQKKVLKDISEWIIAVGKHKGIITSDQFIKTWNLIQNNKNKRLCMPPKNTSVLSGLIKCKKCGSFMRPRLRQTYSINGKQNFSYLCELKEKSRKHLCNCKNIDGLETDQKIITFLKSLKIPSSYLIDEIKQLHIKKDKNILINQKEISMLYNLKHKNEIKIKNLIDKLAIVDKEIMNDIIGKLNELKKENHDVEIKIKTIKSQNNEPPSKANIYSLARDIINNYNDSFDSFDLIDQKELIKIVIKDINIEDNNIFLRL